MGAIGGVYEIAIGTRDARATIDYWTQFGYTEGVRGQLDAGATRALYGVDSPLSSVRLRHQNADHGLIRVMQWQRPLGDGLAMHLMRARGNRWAAMLTTDVLTAANHAEVARAAGRPIAFLGPFWDTIYAPDTPIEPFRDRPMGVRELMLIRPTSRQFLFQRFNYALPYYGAVAASAPIPTSQVTHVGLVIQDDSRDTMRFYDEVLGLLRIGDKDGESTYENSPTGRQVFELAPGERYFSQNFDDPRSSRSDRVAVRSGRLKIIRYPESLSVPDLRDRSRPGHLGMSLYTYAVRDIAAYHGRVAASTATAVTAIASNEFGERSFSFTAPDGYVWTLVEYRQPTE
ncbi:MAG: VOC family protein [Myxococcota bacterium]